ncbi:MAG: PEGA domain-containing protein [Nitrospira sp.]|nr:PEGA domain-containing protein [Nitrospira sp.]
MESIRFRWHVFRQVTIAVVTVSFTGCSIFAPSMQTLHVSSSPDGATVVAGGKLVGETPIQFDAHRGKDLLIEIKKPGYQSQFRTTSRTLSSIGTVDVIGAYFILLPLLGLLSSGAWKHDPETYGFVLEPEK